MERNAASLGRDEVNWPGVAMPQLEWQSKSAGSAFE